MRTRASRAHACIASLACFFVVPASSAISAQVTGSELRSRIFTETIKTHLCQSGRFANRASVSVKRRAYPVDHGGRAVTSEPPEKRSLYAGSPEVLYANFYAENFANKTHCILCDPAKSPGKGGKNRCASARRRVLSGLPSVYSLRVAGLGARTREAMQPGLTPGCSYLHHRPPHRRKCVSSDPAMGQI
jgi:hypothetical protein